MKLLNLGCGNHYHKEWINIDFSSDSEYVKAHNLIKGIPYNDNSIDVVYHSHLLEHFTKKDAAIFIRECYRVLIPQGTIRIAVPDLETIAKEYLRNLNRALHNEPNAESDYDWILLEMYDQTVRNTSGGEMAKYLFRKEIPNKEYVFNRLGNEAKNLHENYLNSKNTKTLQHKASISPSKKTGIGNLSGLAKYILRHTFFRKEFEAINNDLNAFEVGRFRLSGEVHQYMYDRYSLSKLLSGCGFKNIKVVSAFESCINDWNKYQLDTVEGITRKPDSLFIEAIK